MALIGIFVFFSVLGVLCLWGIIEKILNEIIWKIEKYFYDRETKKDIKLYYKNLYENASNFVMILDRETQNGNLKNNMSKVNIIDPKGNKLVVVFGSYWDDMKDFYINVFGNDKGFKYIIRKSNIDTRSILNDYLKARKNSQKTDDITISKIDKDLSDYYWNDFIRENRLINVNSSSSKALFELYSRKAPTNYAINEEYECERCLKAISREEYELYDCMCESCFEDVSYKEDGPLL